MLGASGLIGQFVTDDLRARGFQVVGVARQFSPSRNTNVLDLEMPVMSIDTGALVKTGPAIVLMLVALLTLDNR